MICFYRAILKTLIQTYIMIKNKVIDINIIFETYLKILKIGKTLLSFQMDFCFTKHYTILKNYFLELF